jgi:hypothetical protein
VFVFDTSAYSNGWRDHYPPETFGGVWRLIREGAHDGRIREVFRELTVQDDDVCGWAKEELAPSIVEPDEAVQREAGAILVLFPNPGHRNGADPLRSRGGETPAFHSGDLRRANLCGPAHTAVVALHAIDLPASRDPMLHVAPGHHPTRRIIPVRPYPA